MWACVPLWQWQHWCRGYIWETHGQKVPLWRQGLYHLTGRFKLNLMNWNVCFVHMVIFPYFILQSQEGYLVYECNSLCTCSELCQNRVLQKGVQVKLEVYKTRHKVIESPFILLSYRDSLPSQIFLLFDCRDGQWGLQSIFHGELLYANTLGKFLMILRRIEEARGIR